MGPVMEKGEFYEEHFSNRGYKLVEGYEMS